MHATWKSILFLHFYINGNFQSIFICSAFLLNIKFLIGMYNWRSFSYLHIFHCMIMPQVMVYVDIEVLSFIYNNNVAVNILVHICYQASVRLPLNYIPRSKKFKAKSNYIQLHSNQRGMRVLITLCSHQYLTLPCLFIPASLVGMCYKIAVYNFLIISGGWAAFHMFTNICLSSSVKSPLISFIYYPQLSNFCDPMDYI